MSTANPTNLRVGMAGPLNGIRYRVLGRVVLGMEEDGQLYYWNEFNLVDDRGQGATLVYEETDDGPSWKLFMLFEPSQPLSAAEAARKRVGDRVNLDGTPGPITLRDQSRVYFIEGRAPEGVEVGDIAEYFNVEDGARMLVVSWTGQEVECYRGMSVPADLVQAAFGMSAAAPPAMYTPQYRGAVGDSGRQFAGDAAEQTGTGLVSLRSALILLVVAALGVGAHMSWKKTTTPHGLSSRKTPPPPLSLGTTGDVDQAWVPAGHSVLELARSDDRYGCHEYYLQGADGSNSLLIVGLTGATNQWLWLSPTQPLTPRSPQEAAKLGRGDLVTFPTGRARIESLFQSWAVARDGQRPINAPTDSSFGWFAQGDGQWFLARWTETRLDCFAGRLLSSTEMASFQRKAGTP